MDYSTIFSVSALLFGTAATVSAFGGIAIKEGGHFWELTHRGYVSIAFLLLAAASGILNEITKAHSEAKAAATLQAQVEENSRLTRKINQLLVAPRVALSAHLDDGVLHVGNAGYGRMTNVRLISESAMYINAEFDEINEGELQRKKLNLKYGKIIFDQGQLFQIFGTYGDEEPGWSLPISRIIRWHHRASDSIIGNTTGAFNVLAKEKGLSVELSFDNCVMVEAEDEFGGTYTLPFRLEFRSHSPPDGQVSPSQWQYDSCLSRMRRETGTPQYVWDQKGLRDDYSMEESLEFFIFATVASALKEATATPSEDH